MTKGKIQGTQQRVTLKFLSEHLGLSRTTISLVLNNSPLASTIAPQTRDYVLKAAKKYNYRPNYFARYLNQRRSFLIGVVSPDLSEGYDSELLAGIEGHLLESQYQYFVTSHRWSEDRIRKTAQTFLERGVEGVILINTPGDLGVDVPVITIGKRTASGRMPCICIDNEAGMRQVLEHLVALGHRNIAFMKGHKASADTEMRWSAVTKIAPSLGLRIDPKLVVQLERAGMEPMSAIDEGALCAGKLLSHTAGFTALVAFNDMSAIGAMHKLRDSGLRVPHDVSVAGFDDVIAARIAYPQLTTVRQPLREMGERAARELITWISEGVPNNNEIVLSPVLVARNSTSTAKRCSRS